MADENNTEIDEIVPPAEVAPPKKRRGLRPKNVASEAIAETPEADVAQPARGRRKRADKPAKEQAVSKTRAKNLAKSAGKIRAAKQATETSAAAPVLDGIADLLQLEEENARLRKALAEKLRTENADLRKRLGLA
ncbi:SyrB-like regulator [Ensifer sp. ENS06]|uniref:SyrB-like regulator n=1 Tax=Ensifer sp. ENS06 TaxID=2769276 RepID=UPI000DDED49E|nr:SyrB-like regulator [Ensifer sp. ENS06]MBD9626319.1 SyrB-like regulator [Ensifer sp. ENS06]